MPDAMRLDPGRAMILVIDVQEKLLPLIDGRAAVVQAAELLVRCGALFEVPVVATEQYPQGIGHTVAELDDALKQARAERFDKMAFSCCGDEAFRGRLRAIDRRQVIVAGIEAHVCVQQTTMDLLAEGYDVYVCADAVGSRSAVDFFVALERMRHAGAGVTTVESALFELCRQCGTADFKAMIDLIKPPRAPDPRFGPMSFAPAASHASK